MANWFITQCLPPPFRIRAVDLPWREDDPTWSAELRAIKAKLGPDGQYKKPPWAKYQLVRETGLVEDMCVHGVGHPNLAWMKKHDPKDKKRWGVHGCDGCCCSKKVDHITHDEAMGFAASDRCANDGFNHVPKEKQ